MEVDRPLWLNFTLQPPFYHLQLHIQRPAMTAVQSQPGGMEVDGSAQAGPSSASAAAVYKRLHPASYLSRYLSKGYRPDGRKTAGWRDVSVNLGMPSDSISSRIQVDVRLHLNCERLFFGSNGRNNNGMWDQGRSSRTQHCNARRRLCW